MKRKLENAHMNERQPMYPGLQLVVQVFSLCISRTKLSLLTNLLKHIEEVNNQHSNREALESHVRRIPQIILKKTKEKMRRKQIITSAIVSFFPLVKNL